MTSTFGVSTGGSPIASGDLFRSIFDNSLEAILITDPTTGTIIEANPEACRLFGGSVAEMRALEREEFADLTDPRTVHALARRAETGRFAGIVTMRRKDGTRFEADLLSTMFTGLGGEPRCCVFVRDITQREQAAKSLMASEHRYRSLVETTASVLLGVTQDGMIFEWNTEAHHVFGHSRREVLGRNYLELFVPAAARDTWRAQVRQVMAGESVRNLEATVIARDGRERRILWNVARLLDATGEPVGVLASGQDITERIRAEDTLRNVKALVESARDLIAYADIDGRLLFANASARRLLGIDDVACLTIFDLVSPRALPRARSDVLPRLLEMGSWSGEASLRSARSGEELVVELTAFLVRDARGTEARYIACVARDIADRKRLEAERREFESKMRHAQKLESLGVLAGGIAHDFNNLLVGILGNASLALMDLDESSPLHEVVHDIETTARRAADLTRQMLAYSGRGKFVVKPVNLTVLVEEMAQLLQTVITKGAVLRFDFASELPSVDADETQLRQIVMNLITNASDAIGSRSGFITLRTGVMHADRAYLRSTYLDEELDEGHYAYVEVVDTGVGMDAETLSRIFDPFFSTKFTGRGLGLSATLGIVRGHRGTVHVSSTLGRGTTFRVLFPCSGAAAAEPTITPAPTPLPGGATILVVDDDETVRNVTRTMLERRGYSVMLATDGRDGLARFEREHDRISLVLLDLTMPHMSGEEAFRAMRAARPDVRVVLMSGFSGQELSERYAQEGLAGFIQKPFRMNDLDAVLTRALGHVSPARA